MIHPSSGPMLPALPLLAALFAFGATASGGARAAEAQGSSGWRWDAGHPVVRGLVAMIESSPGRCAELPPDHPQRRIIEADVARFRAVVPAAAGVRFDVLDCYWDGLVDRGERIVLSARLARATPAQRFFVIAHEFGHFALGHHAALAGLVVELLHRHEDVGSVAQALAGNAAGALSRRHEAEADAFATHATLLAGLDVEEAARFFEQNGLALKTHPAPSARAQAIRALAGIQPAGAAP